MTHAGGLRLHLTRDSVALGDDHDAPHFKKVRLPDGSTVEDAVSWIAASSYLPRIVGGEATWSVLSRTPIAVLAQQWNRPMMLSPAPYDLEKLDYADNTLRIHVTYHEQRNPNGVFVFTWRDDCPG